MGVDAFCSSAPLKGGRCSSLRNVRSATVDANANHVGRLINGPWFPYSSVGGYASTSAHKNK